MDRNEILKLVKEDRFEEVLEVPIGAPLDNVRHCFMLMRSRHNSDDEACAAMNKAWTTLRHETSQERLERICRISHILSNIGGIGGNDKAIQHLRKALTLPGDRKIVRRNLAAYLNALAVEKANKANEMLKNAQSKMLENIIHGNWF